MFEPITGDKNRDKPRGAHQASARGAIYEAIDEIENLPRFKGQTAALKDLRRILKRAYWKGS